MSILRKMFWPEASPITSDDVEPSGLTPEQEAEGKAALDRMMSAVLTTANRSLELRTRLAEETLRIVSGDSR